MRGSKPNGKEQRINAVRELQAKYHITNTNTIAKALNISETTAKRIVKDIRQEARNILTELINGEFIVEFHNTLLRLKKTMDTCEEEILRLKQSYEENKRLMSNTLEQLTLPMARVNMLNNIAELDYKYHSSLQSYQKLDNESTKSFLQILGETEMIWAYDSLVANSVPTDHILPKVPAKQVQELVDKVGDDLKGKTFKTIEEKVTKPIDDVIKVVEKPTNKDEKSVAGKKLVP